MRIGRTNPPGGYVLYPDGRESVYLKNDVVHALGRLFMEAQRAKDAGELSTVYMRNNPITDQDIANALIAHVPG